MPSRYEQRLLDYLTHDSYSPRTVSQLAADLRAETDEEVSALNTAVERMRERGQLRVDGAGRVSLPSIAESGGELEGIFRANPRGFGFVETVGDYLEGDIFVPPSSTMDAMSGDKVRVKLRRDRRREREMGGDQARYVGEVVEILERMRTTFSGEVDKRGGQWLVFPDGKRMTDPIVVRDAESKNVKPGDKVVVDIVEFPEGGSLAEGVISKVLGEAGQPDVETQAIIAAHDLPGEFPDACLDEARRVTRAFEDEVARFEERGASVLELRRDMTGDFIVTIDPPDAKDYDDAISLRRLDDGGWELGVHIADVSHFIQPGSALDTEAMDRGNSVYLPRLVIPMLPELLSNGICSLQEGVTRFAKSAFMRYDKQGHVKREWAASTVIRSAKRMTYLEAQALIDGDKEEAKKHAKTEPDYTPELIDTLKQMDALARAIRGRRQRQGMISLELPDVELVFDESGRVVDAVQEDDAFTHTIIEMFMVEANEVLARLFEGMGVPLLRRTHPEPTPGDDEDLRKAARVAGYTIPKNPTREELQSLLDSTRGTPASRAVHMAVLRTLTKATYSPSLVGHYALASSAYAHFTSPIRRYPDLTVHRALSEYLRLTDNGEKRPKNDEARTRMGKRLMESELCPPEQALVETGRHCTSTEERAEEAERELRQFLVLQLLAEHIGEEYEGVVTGVNPRGVYVQLSKYLAEGMIKREDLPGDTTRSDRPPKWRIDDKTGALVDAHSGRSFNMGDLVRVRVANVDLSRRQMDLVIADPDSRASGKAKKSALKLGSDGAYGGLAAGKGGADKFKVPGGQRRSRKSKQRDKRKADHRKDRKDKGKRQ